jgi:hypothetical protein
MWLRSKLEWARAIFQMLCHSERQCVSQRFITAIEAIYDAAADPELWPEALSAIGACFAHKHVDMLSC